MDPIKVNTSDYHKLNPNSINDESHPPILPLYYNNRTRLLPSFTKFTWFLLFIGVLCAVFGLFAIKHFGPTFMRKAVIPVIHWLVNTCSQPELGAIVFGAIALFPIFLLPTVPFKWVAGMTFGYGLGFLLIMIGVAVAMTLPYFIAYHLFLQKIERWLDNNHEKAAFVRLAGDGDWLHQFKAIALLRLSPFPYVVLNYVAVVTGVKYSPYLAGSLIGIVPEVLFAIYSGKLLRTVAEAMEDHTQVSKYQIIFDGIGFCLSAAATIAIGFYAKRKLEQLQVTEQQEQLR